MVSSRRSALLIPSHPSFQRLLREARVWSQLEIGVDTNYIVPLYGISFDLGVIGAPCLVSPYYKNGNVESYLKHNPLVDRISLVRFLFKTKIQCIESRQLGTDLASVFGPRISS